MGLNLESIPELPTESHPFFLLPERRAHISDGNGGELQITYRETGSGPAVFLLHGPWTTALTFRHLIEPLKGDFRLIMPELYDPQTPGKECPAGLRPEALAAFFAGLFAALSEEPPLVVAHAESGLAGLYLAVTRPGCLRSLITVGTAVTLPFFLRIKGHLHKGPRFAARLARSGFKQPVQAALAMLDYADPTVFSRQEIRNLARLWASLPAARGTASALAATRSPAYRRKVTEALQAAAARGAKDLPPVKMIHGSRDRLAPPSQGQELSRLLTGSELLVAEQSGGTVQVEQANWLARVIRSAGGK